MSTLAAKLRADLAEAKEAGDITLQEISGKFPGNMVVI